MSDQVTTAITAEMIESDVMTAEEAALLLRVHLTTIHMMCREGALPAIKAGRDWRISRSGVQEKLHLGDVHTDLVERISDRAAEKAIAGLAALFAGAFSSAVTRQQVEQLEKRTQERP